MQKLESHVEKNVEKSFENDSFLGIGFLFYLKPIKGIKFFCQGVAEGYELLRSSILRRPDEYFSRIK